MCVCIEMINIAPYITTNITIIMTMKFNGILDNMVFFIYIIYTPDSINSLHFFLLTQYRPTNQPTNRPTNNLRTIREWYHYRIWIQELRGAKEKMKKKISCLFSDPSWWWCGGDKILYFFISIIIM